VRRGRDWLSLVLAASPLNFSARVASMSRQAGIRPSSAFIRRLEKSSAFSAYHRGHSLAFMEAMLWIRITVMRIRIRLITQMRIRIQILASK
jgi:hypothetical protein